MGILKPVTVIALLLKAVVLGATRVLKQTLTRYRPDSIFLRAGYAPVSTELDRSSLRVIGTIPADLRGMFVRTGPNPQFHPIADYHWFDGDGMLHGVQFSDEGCRYVNRFVRTTRYLYEKKLGKAFFYGLMQFSNLFLVIYHSVRQAIGKQSRLGAKPLDGAANTSVELHAGRFFALHEASLPYQVQLPNLETLKQFDFDGKLKHQMTAHPKVDLETGEMFFFGYNLRSKPYLNYSYARKDGTLVATLPIDLEVPVMMHDFAVSKRYAIFMDLPLTFDVKRIVRDRPVIEFEPERGSRFGILPRTASTGSEIRWFKSPACFVYHTAGAYEEGDDVVLVASRLEKAQVFGLDKQSLEAYPEFMSKPYMWRFNMKTGAVTEGVIADVVADFPRIHPELLCKKFTFAYFAGLETKDREPRIDSVVKLNVQTAEMSTHVWGGNKFGGECVFVPAAKAKSEDDGYLMTFVTDETLMTTELVILNAKDITAGPIARVMMPQRVPYGFHGKYITAKEIATQRLD